ncbi:uncharacterized protein BJX67DRAFT_389144 [Aspergillus lucknowensis]|uniref:GA4 desaturase family protein n=1 Tax=Aspergillus lucknowensis TaxID=176173 RepID=A0ABR4M4T7_9EURO
MSPAVLPLHSLTPGSDAARGRRDIETMLNYWRKPEDGQASIDFREAGAEQLFDELDNLEESQRVTIHDIRGREAEYTIEKNGFQYIHHPIPEYNETWNEKRVVHALLPKTKELVEELTGAIKSLIYAHRVRCFYSGDRAPVHIVHSDFTSAGALQHLRTLISESELNHLQQTNTRILALNIWRPLGIVKKDPLAVCDWASVNSTEDIIPNRFTFPDGWLEVAKMAYSKKHRWCYLSHQRPDEVLVFTQFDTHRLGGRSVAHSAFVDPKYAKREEPRRSLEVGVFVFLENE